MVGEERFLPDLTDGGHVLVLVFPQHDGNALRLYGEACQPEAGTEPGDAAAHLHGGAFGQEAVGIGGGADGAGEVFVVLDMGLVFVGLQGGDNGGEVYFGAVGDVGLSLGLGGGVGEFVGFQAGQ